MKRIIVALIRGPAVLALAVGALFVTASPARADAGFSLTFSDAINQPSSPAPYSATATFHVVGSQLIVDVHNTSTTWISELGFGLNPALNLSNPVLSGTGTSGYTAGLDTNKQLDGFGNFEYDIVLGGTNGGHLGVEDWEVTTDISGLPPAVLDPAFSKDGMGNPTDWYGAIHFGPLGNNPTLFGASSTEGSIGPQGNFVPEGPSMAMMGFGLIPFLGLALLKRRRTLRVT